MSLSHYESLARQHWKEFLPKRWKALKEAGTLEEELEKAAELTDRDMQAALAAGVPRDQAWEDIRGRHLLPTPEPLSPEDEDRLYGPNPNRRALKLLHDAIDATQSVYDDL